MKYSIAVFLTVLALNGGGCATMRDSVLLGAGIGGGTGALSGGLIGGQSQHEVNGALIGTAVGAGVGALIGYVVNKSNSKVPVSSSASAKPDDYPKLSNPDVERIWVDDRIEGDQYIKGHHIYIIKQKGYWKAD